MKIFTLDLSTRRTGWALGDVGAKAPSAFGVFEMKPTGDDIGLMLCTYEDWLSDMYVQHVPDRIYFEAPILSKSTITARKLMGMASETERHCRRLNVPCEEVNLTAVKTFFAGHGWAEKEHMIARAIALGWDVGNDDDKADACGIWLYACAVLDPEMRSFKAPKLYLPPRPKKAKPEKKAKTRKSRKALSGEPGLL